MTDDIVVDVKNMPADKSLEDKKLSRPLCSKCGKSFVSIQVLEKHVERKVCDRKMVHQNKIRKIMLDAVKLVEN